MLYASIQVKYKTEWIYTIYQDRVTYVSMENDGKGVQGELLSCWGSADLDTGYLHECVWFEKIY